MHIKSDYITHEVNGKQVLLDASGEFSGIVRSNATAAFIVECLQKDTTQEEIVEAMFAKYDAPMEVISKDVAAIIEKLKKIGAIE